MRPDMAKVVTERPRRGHSNKSKKTGLTVHKDKYEDDDHGSTRHKASRHGQYGWDSKEFSDLLGPLRGYLKKQVGRPWDKIYSELCQTLDRRSISGQHIWDHVTFEVELHAYMDNGKVMRAMKYGGGAMPVSGLYVHPVTGLLRLAPTWRYRYRPRKDPDLIKLDEPLTELRRMDGIWYRVVYEVFPQFFTVTDNAGNVSTRRGRDIVKIKTKAQLSKRELAAQSLTNTPEIKPLTKKDRRRLSRAS